MMQRKQIQLLFALVLDPEFGAGDRRAEACRERQ